MERMKKARIGLMSLEPFFGSLASKLELVEDAKAPSTWTDGKRLGFNPEWATNTPMPELEAVVAHHVLSCALGHHLRRGARESKLWQEASDYVVNLELQRAGFTLPQGSLVDSQYDKMTVEQVFKSLNQKPEQDDSGDDSEGGDQGKGDGAAGQGDAGEKQKGDSGAAGDAATGTCEDATDDSGEAAADESERAEQMAEWKEAAAEAAQLARGMDKLPGGIERGVLDFLNSKVDWREALQRLLKSKAKDDHSWLKPSRRSPAGFFLPGRHSEACGPLAFFVDVSGSINQKQIDQAVSEIEEARISMKPERVIVYMFDTQVRRRFEFGQHDPIEGVRAIAGGGTAFDDPIYELEREAVTPEVAIYLTDLDARTFAPEPHYPVVWVSTYKQDAPYGDIIMMED